MHQIQALNHKCNKKQVMQFTKRALKCTTPSQTETQASYLEWFLNILD